MEEHLDRIAEAYNGDMGKWMMEKSRERIDWICSKVKGKMILDVGCSQGICPIILGRGGLDVTGIDIAVASIEYAINRLIHEDFSTQKNVRFFCGDFLQFPIEEKAYDTIIMTEFLEHINDPGAFVDKARICLRDNGRIIVTVPFGIHDFPDHKRTYYLADIYQLLARYFFITKIKFFGKKWIGFVADAVLEEGQTAVKLNLELLQLEEKEFFAIERALINTKNKEIAERQKIEALYQHQVENNAVLTQERDLLSNERANLMENNITLTEESESLRRELLSLTREKAECDKELSLTKIQRDAFSADRNELKKQCDTLTEKNKKLFVEKEWYHQKYNLLANAKLGRLTLWYWPKKDRFLAWKRRKVVRLKDVSKKIPGLRQLQKTDKTKKDLVSQVVTEPLPPVKSKFKSKVKADQGYFNRIAPMIKEIPESNGGRFYKKINLRIGVICDPFYYDSVYAAADFIYLSPEDWEEKLDGLDLFLLVSSWTGLRNEEWRGSSTEGSKKRMLQYQIIEKCQEKGIPTVFYSKEDPVNYTRYIGAAQKCDYVFTTAKECIPDYMRDCGHNKVYSMCFGINPIFHNPVGFRHFKKSAEVVFSGTWMAERKERCTDLARIFDGILDSGRKIKIIDRMFKFHDDSRYRVPDKYFRYASPAIGHDDLQKVHKLYDWAVNINTVKISSTMFANRVYELQAAGNLLLSNYSVGVNSHLPTVFIVHDKEEAGHILDGFNPEDLYEHQVSGIRNVMTGETCYDRVAELLEKVGLPAVSTVRRVAVVADKLTPGILAAFERQTYPDKELVAVSDVTDELLEGFDVVAFFTDGAKYGVFYLEDMVNGFKYSDSDYITKDAFMVGGDLCPGLEHEYVSVMRDKYRTIFWRESFTSEQLLAIDGETDLPNGYSIDHFNYDAGPVCRKDDKEYKLSVIVPVYNNGWHLYGKAFASLRRSTMFNDMEIILVDDGSTDGLTLKMEEYLADRYPNVHTFSFGDGGSGSASRPRNKGVELSTAEYITFLDPDNEAVCDGYTRLYHLAVRKGFDLVVGNMVRYQKTAVRHNYYYSFSEFYGSDEVDGDKNNFLKRIDFRPMSIQAMVIQKSLITGSGIKQVEGAIGQDSLFSWQLIANADRIKAVPWTIHLYYAGTEGSTVNTIGKSFFEKRNQLEPVCIAWLNETSLMSSYMSQRYKNYTKDWILTKLTLAKPDEVEDCVKSVYYMLCMYKDYYDKSDAVINRFMEICDIRDYGEAFDYIYSELGPKTAAEPPIPDEGFFDQVSDQVKAISVSNEGRYYEKSSLKAGVISDEFIYNSFKDAADCVYLFPDNWHINIEGIDLLFLITPWRGLHEKWRGCALEGDRMRELIYNIIRECRGRGIPTVFYSKEDPPNYKIFIGMAQKCDYVFTTAREMIPEYIRDCGHERVYCLKFGINPLFHNPVGFRRFKKSSDVVFSGSWMKKYPQRCSDLQKIFNGVLRSGHGLKIIDRNFYIKSQYNKFPDKYLPYISPAIGHEDLQKVHKLFDWAININSVKESATMFANRAYELQATGNLMLSNYSVGVNECLPIIYTIQNSGEIPIILNTLTPEEIYERQITGIRFSMTGESSYDRFNELIARAGFPTKVQGRSIAVLAKEITVGIQEMFHRQSLKNKTLLSEAEVTDEVLAQFDMVAFFDENMDYFEFYLEDMCNGFKYTDSDYITKDAYLSGSELVEGVEHDFVNIMRCKYRTVFWRNSFTTKQLLSFENTVTLKNGYSIDHFNYDAKPVGLEKLQREYKLSVIVPVLNNGKRLYGKAFASLRRNNIFGEMQIILVDRGSSDGFTDKMVSYIARRYNNVMQYYFADNEPVSLAEARAKGLMLAEADWIVLLNPENEAVDEGYAKLLEAADEYGLELVMGDVMEFNSEPYLRKNSDFFDGVCRSDEDKSAFLASFFRAPADLQSAVISRDLLSRVNYNDLPTISHELLLKAGASIVIPVTIVNIYTLID